MPISVSIKNRVLTISAEKWRSRIGQCCGQISSIFQNTLEIMRLWTISFVYRVGFLGLKDLSMALTCQIQKKFESWEELKDTDFLIPGHSNKNPLGGHLFYSELCIAQFSAEFIFTLEFFTPIHFTLYPNWN